MNIILSKDIFWLKDQCFCNHSTQKVLAVLLSYITSQILINQAIKIKRRENSENKQTTKKIFLRVVQALALNSPQGFDFTHALEVFAT